MHNGEQATILVVDDTSANLELLEHLLSKENYRVRALPDGKMALRAAFAEPPDIILLDIKMPGMDGYEVCRQLKADKRTTEIPIIFISALQEINDKVQAFQAGGVDYISKPFQTEEVLARVKTHLILAEQQHELEQKNYQLENRNEELDAFAHTVAHDLKNPLGSIKLAAELLKDFEEKIDDDEYGNILNLMRLSAEKAVDIVEALLLLAGTSNHTRLKFSLFYMDDVISSVMERMALEMQAKEATITYPDNWPSVIGYPPWIEEVWFNYISNALKYGGQPPEIELGFDHQEGFIRFWVKDNGPGLTDEQKGKLFVPFARLHTERADGHGLGLVVVQRIINKLNGFYGVENGLEGGSLFFFMLPLEEGKNRSNV